LKGIFGECVVLLALATSYVNGSAIASRRAKRAVAAMLRHVKIIGLSVGLLVILSGLSNASIALAAFQ
jgi:hypothetical protein